MLKFKSNIRYILEIFSFPLAILMAKRKRITIFLFHEVSDNPSQFAIDYDLYVTTHSFRKQIRWIKRNFKVITPLELLKEEESQGVNAMITFDDGSESIFNNAAQILTEENLSATVFINMAPVNGEVFWSGKICYLFKHENSFREKMHQKYGKKAFLYCSQQDIDNWSELQKIDDFEDRVKSYYGRFASIEQLEESCEGNIFLGNHLYNHFNATAISEKELTDQYLSNFRSLSQFDNFINIFSYPYGQPNSCYNEVTDNLIKKLGALMIFSAFSIPNKHSKLTRKMHRIAVSNNDDHIFRLLFKTFIRPLLNKYLYVRKYV